MQIDQTLLLTNEPFEVGRAAVWLDGLVAEAGYPPRVVAALQVALEEVLSNLLCHGYTDLETHQIELRLTADSASATLEFFDDGITFDLTRHEVAVPDGNTNTRPGGLGLLFIRRLMDEVAFERLDGRNHLTLRKFVSL